MADYSAGSASVTITPDLSRFAATLRTELQRIRQNYGVTIDPDLNGFSERLRAELDAVPRNSVDVNVDADTATATAKLQALTTVTRTATVNVDADTAAATARINAAARNHTANIRVDQDGAGTAEAKIAAAARNRTARIRVDTSAATSAITSLGTATAGVLASGAQVGGMASAIGSIGVFAAGAIGPLSALGGGLISAAGSLAAFPGIAAGALAGVAALGIGLNGVGGAFSALGKASESAGTTASTGMDTAAQAAENAARGVERAQRSVQDAERGVADAQRASKRAQDSLNDARKEAVRNLEDMNDRLKDSALDEEGAVLAVARAKERLQETRSDGSSSALDIQEADLAYRKAVNTLEDTRSANNRLATDTAAANAAGVEGAKNVVSAKEQVQSAARGEEDAARRVEDAQIALADAQRQAAQAAAQASTQAASGADAAAAAMAKLSPNAQSFVLAVRAMGDQWSELRRATQDNLFAGMDTAITRLGEKQLPVLKTGMTGIASALNTDIRDAMGVFSTDDAANKFGTFLGNSRRGIDALGNAMSPISEIWINLTTAGSAYFERFGNSVTGVFDKWNNSLKRATENGDFDRFMDRSINSAKQMWSIFSNLGGALANVFSSASATSGGFLEELDNTMQRFNAWTESVEGQDALREFFTATGGALRAVSPLIGKVANIFATVFAPAISAFVQNAAPGFSTFLDGVKSGMEGLAPAMPGLGDAFGALAASLAPVISALGHSLGPALQVLTPAITALAPALGPTVSLFGGFSLALMKLSPLIKLFSANFTVLGTLLKVGKGILSGVTTAWKLLSLAFSASPIGMLIVAIGALVAGLVWFFTQTEVGKKAWKSFMNFLSTVWDGITDGFKWVWEKVSEFLGGIVDFIKDIPEKFGELKDMIFDKVADAGSWLLDTGKDLVDGLLNGIGNIGEAIGNWILDKVPGPIKKVIKKALGLEDGGEVPGLRFGGAVIGLPTYAGGGALPTTGPGTREVDGILGVGDDGTPTARVNAGEYVVTASQADRFRTVLPLLNAGNRDGAIRALQAIPGRAAGGLVPGGITALAAGGSAGLSGTFTPPGIDTGSLSSAGSAFATAAQGMQNVAAQTLNPIWQQQQTGITGFGTAVTNAATSVRPQFTSMAASLFATKNGTIDPVLRGITTATTGLATNLRTQALTVVQPTWANMGRFMDDTKTGVIDPMFEGVNTSLSFLGSHVMSTAENVVQPVWRNMSTFMEQVRTSGIDPTFDAIGTGLTTLEGWFSTTATNVGTAWDRIRPGTGKPARFVVETVFNNGIRDAWNNIADLIDGKKLNPVGLGGLGSYATGGTVDTLPGYSPGYDNHTFTNGSGTKIHLSGGESIMRPEWTRAVGGRGAVNRMNRQAQNGSLGAHSTGGIVPGGNAFADGGIYNPNAKELGQLGGAPIATSLWRAAKTAFPNATLNSAKTDHGIDRGYHPMGGAVDLGGPMQQIANWIFKTYPNSAQLIFGPGPLILNGKTGHIPNTDQAGIRAAYTEPVMAGHYNHVHWASDGVITSAGKMVSMDPGSGGVAMVSMQDMVNQMWKSDTSDIPKYDGPKSQFGDAANKLRSVMIDKVGEFAGSQAEKFSVGPGSPIGEGAERWRPMVIKAFQFQGEEPRADLVDALVRQIDSESSGEEAAVQNGYVDVNTGGNEAVGLLQFTPGTFDAYHDPRVPGGRENGWANLNAGVRYFRDFHDYDTGYVGQGHGWKDGGVVEEDDLIAPAAASTVQEPGKEDPIYTGDVSADDLNEFRVSEESDPAYYDGTSGTGSNYQAPGSYADIIAKHFGYTPPSDTTGTGDKDVTDPATWQSTYEGIAYSAASGFLDDALGLLGIPTTPPPALLAADALMNIWDKRAAMDPAERTIAEHNAQRDALKKLPDDLKPAAKDLINAGYNLLGDEASQEDIYAYIRRTSDEAYAKKKAEEAAAAGDATAPTDGTDAATADLNAAADSLAATGIDDLEKFANGGLIGGKGGGKDDMVNILASSGEFISTAATAAQAGPLLAAMNANPAAAGALQAALLTAQGVGSGLTTSAATLSTVQDVIGSTATGYRADFSNVLNSAAAGAQNSAAPIELHYHVETNTAQEGLRMSEQAAKQQMIIMSGA